MKPGRLVILLVMLATANLSSLADAQVISSSNDKQPAYAKEIADAGQNGQDANGNANPIPNANPDPNPNPDAAANQSKSAGATGTTNGGKKINWATLPFKSVAFAVGAVVGTPICMARKIVDEEKDGIKGCVGDTDKQHMRIIAGMFWLPFAATVGAAEAPVYSTINSLVNADKPFSKDQFSLGEMAAR